VNTSAALERFVSVYNEPGSPVYPLYADEVIWQERPGGRGGDRDALFTALRASREKWTATLESVSMEVDGDLGVLNSLWRAEPKSDPALQPVVSDLLWVFRFDAAGLITTEFDYSFRRAS